MIFAYVCVCSQCACLWANVWVHMHVWSPENDARHLSGLLSIFIIESGSLTESPVPCPAAFKVLGLQDLAITMYLLWGSRNQSSGHHT